MLLIGVRHSTVCRRECYNRDTIWLVQGEMADNRGGIWEAAQKAKQVLSLQTNFLFRGRGQLGNLPSVTGHSEQTHQGCLWGAAVFHVLLEAWFSGIIWMLSENLSRCNRTSSASFCGCWGRGYCGYPAGWCRSGYQADLMPVMS